MRKKFLFSFTLSGIGILIALLVCGNVHSQDTGPGPVTSDSTDVTPGSYYTFTKLRSLFKNPILDADFKTLKEVTQTKVYLDFLKQAYPTEETFENLNGLLKVTMTAPPHERYETFLTEHFENLSQADFQSIHLMTLMFRYTDIKMQIAEQTKDQKALRKMMMHRVTITLKEPIRTWWKTRISGEKKAKQMAFILALDHFAKQTQKEDTHWIQAQFDAYGKENAMLWIAIWKPLLLGEILITFREPDTFLRWIEQTSISKKSTEK